MQKVNTKAELKLDLFQASWIPLEVADSLKSSGRKDVTNNGMLVIKNDENRSQIANQEACMQLLVSILKDTGRKIAPAPTTKEQKMHVNNL